MKRGLSTVVSTILIIAIIVVAMIIIWALIRAMLEESTDDIRRGTSRVILDIIDGSVNVGVPHPELNEPAIELSVARNAEEGSLKKVRFILNFKDGNEILDNSSEMGPSESSVFYVPFGDLTLLESISVAPILKTSSGEDFILPVTDTYEFTDDQKFMFFFDKIWGWWRFDNSLKEELKGRNNGTGKEPTYEPNGKYGEALNYSGEGLIYNEKNITLPENSSFKGGLITLSFWMKSNSSNVDFIYQNLTNRTAPVNSHVYYIGLNDEGKLQFNITGPIENWYNTSDESYNDSNWHYVFVMLDEGDIVDQDDDEIKMYVDGELVAHNPEEEDIPHKVPYVIWPTVHSNVDAKIDEFIIWRRALKPDEVKAINGLHLRIFD